MTEGNTDISPDQFQTLRGSNWVQNIPSGQVTPITFEGIGTYDVDIPLYKAVRKGVYFPDFPNLNEVKSSAPSSHDEVIETARSRGLVIGFSGYATGGEGYDYEAELEAMKLIFDTLQKRKGSHISLAIHGGTREGVPVLANMIAIEHGVDSMGMLPTCGLDWLPAQSLDYLVVTGKRWGDESETLGQSPDILFLLGGGNNALKDCEAALARGRKLVAVRFKEYPQTSAINTISKEKFTAECSNSDELERFLETL